MTQNHWNESISQLPNPHFLQTYEWGQVKAAYGWQPHYLVWDEARCTVSLQPPAPQPATLKAAALVLKRMVPTSGLAARLSILYTPKGPLLDWNDLPLRTRVLDDLQRFARQQGAIFLKLDPDVVLGRGLPGSETEMTEAGGQAVRQELSRRGWRFSEDQIQFKNTVLVEVGTSTEEEILARMKQKTRYNVRLGPKKGVSVRVGNQTDWPMLYKMYAETSARDGFIVRDENYYRTVWSKFDKTSAEYAKTQITNNQFPNMPLAEPLIAEVEGEPVAAVFLFAFGGRAYYVYGMSRDAHREKMPAYLLQWEALKWAKSHGCATYDLWGAPDVFDPGDGMWGVFRFKEGLGGQVVRTLGAWDFAPNPFWYAIYTKFMPKLLNVMRSRGKARLRQRLSG
ncbi:MAG: peptidoglycan bridge formation glycyltransferase FemA/FemB family protein [Anaerolineales bacterium]|jgi:lipid II:glycine glycyltransferase (peptidoglycan interpeptide bridge formation enzyme)|nr:peptidoglycan bridge formation glycyltransferase FemA/FemB family protein [Anaerolineales bacterium]